MNLPREQQQMVSIHLLIRRVEPPWIMQKLLIDVAGELGNVPFSSKKQQRTRCAK